MLLLYLPERHRRLDVPRWLPLVAADLMWDGGLGFALGPTPLPPYPRMNNMEGPEQRYRPAEPQ